MKPRSFRICLFSFLIFVFPRISYANLDCERGRAFKPIADILSGIGKMPVKLDQRQLRPWTAEARIPCKPLFTATYDLGGRKLIFVAVEHIGSRSTSSVEDSQLLADIERVIVSEKPNGVVVEAIVERTEASHPMNSKNPSCYDKNGWPVCGEAVYAMDLALQNQAEVLGGEPDSHWLQSKAIQIGSKEDYFALISTRVWSELHAIPNQAHEDAFNKKFQSRYKISDSEWSWTQYKEWLKKNMNAQPEDFKRSWMEPRSDGSANALQRINSKLESTREAHILNRLEQMVNRHEKTMIVYGSGHYYKQSPALERALGRPKLSCPEPNKDKIRTWTSQSDTSA